MLVYVWATLLILTNLEQWIVTEFFIQKWQFCFSLKMIILSTFYLWVQKYKLSPHELELQE